MFLHHFLAFLLLSSDGFLCCYSVTVCHQRTYGFEAADHLPSNSLMYQIVLQYIA